MVAFRAPFNNILKIERFWRKMGVTY